METFTFTMNNETEASALVSYFADCGIKATHKGKVVKASGEKNLIAYLYNIFLTQALI
jgi:hypothetical protein